MPKLVSNRKVNKITKALRYDIYWLISKLLRPKIIVYVLAPLGWALIQPYPPAIPSPLDPSSAQADPKPLTSIYCPKKQGRK